MKATLHDDIIIRVHKNGDTEIGPLIKGVGFERLRFDGSQVVDLFDLATIHVVDLGGHFSLHCREITRPGEDEFGNPVMETISQPVAMSYADRKNLVNDNSTIRLKTQAELDQEAADLQAEISEQAETNTELRSSVFATVTIALAEQYIDSQVTDLASAKQALKIMVRYQIAMRNAIKQIIKGRS